MRNRKSRISNRFGAAKDAALSLDTILRSAGEAAYEWDLAGDVLKWTGNAAAVLGIRDAALISTGRGYANLLDPGNRETRFDAVMRSSGKDEGHGVPYQIQYCLRAAPRAPKTWIEDIGRWFAGPDGSPARTHGVIRCINDRYAREQELAYLSGFDSLTGEINRRRLAEVLEETLEECARVQSSCGFLLVAIDHLERVNEAYGYEVADEVIGAVAKRLRRRMRSQDCLGRFSGHKFGIILKNCSPNEMKIAAERLLAGIRDNVVMTTAGPVPVTVTIGGVTAPRHADNVATILWRAQETLDRAKAKRPGSFLAYHPNREREALRRENMRATDKIVSALNERRILLAYEPIVDVRSRAPVLYECLLRIRRPDGSLVPATDIIPVAERLGLVRFLDQRVLELAIAELVNAPQLRLCLNVSPASITNPDWWVRLDSLLRAHPGTGERLTVEITESAAIQDIDDAIGFVRRLKDFGCCIAIDDFGAGYTSFRNLRRLGVDVIKIDGAFVQNLARSEDDCAFVHTLIDLGRRLSLKTVAEWVRDEKSVAMLAEWGCDWVQGEVIGRASLERAWLQGAREIRADSV